MLANLKELLRIAEEKQCAIPAFNVYNLETVQGVAQAAKALNAPVIFQIYSRLFAGEQAALLAPAVLAAIACLPAPAAFHLDHGADDAAVQRALRLGVSGVMRDASALPFEGNVAHTRRVVECCAAVGVPVEGELGHVGTTGDASMEAFTDPREAQAFVRATGVDALAVLVGTAHGRYQQAPKLDIERIRAIHESTGLPLVLHGGSGVPDDQIRASIAAGIRKVNFGTDVCYAFLDSVFETGRETVAIDLFMRAPVESVRAFAMEKIRLLGAEG